MVKITPNALIHLDMLKIQFIAHNSSISNLDKKNREMTNFGKIRSPYTYIETFNARRCLQQKKNHKVLSSFNC